MNTLENDHRVLKLLYTIEESNKKASYLDSNDEETGILITALVRSTRFKQKHMLKVREKPIVYYLIERIRKFKEEIAQNNLIKVVIATSDEPDNCAFGNDWL